MFDQTEFIALNIRDLLNQVAKIYKLGKDNGKKSKNLKNTLSI